MQIRFPKNTIRLPVLLVLCLISTVACTSSERPEEGGHYELRPSESREGTGRFYRGREIARSLPEGHLWFERQAREVEELPERLVEALELKADDVVADIGAGTGYLTFRLAERVPSGKVYAVDIDPALLDTIRARMAERNVRNVVPVLGSEEDPNLPPGVVDVALIVASYHEFSHPYEMMRHIAEALKPGGRVVIVEYRGEDATIPVPDLHRMTEAQVRDEMEAVGLIWRETKTILPQQHLMIFEKPVD